LPATDAITPVGAAADADAGATAAIRPAAMAHAATVRLKGGADLGKGSEVAIRGRPVGLGIDVSRDEAARV